jgi:hypothetical protein
MEILDGACHKWWDNATNPLLCHWNTLSDPCT